MGRGRLGKSAGLVRGLNVGRELFDLDLGQRTQRAKQAMPMLIDVQEPGRPVLMHGAGLVEASD